MCLRTAEKKCCPQVEHIIKNRSPKFFCAYTYYEDRTRLWWLSKQKLLFLPSDLKHWVNLFYSLLRMYNEYWIVLYIVQLSKCTQKNIFFWNIFSDFFLFRMRPNFSFFRIAWYVVVFKKMKMNQEGRVKTKKKKKYLAWELARTWNIYNQKFVYVLCDID